MPADPVSLWERALVASSRGRPTVAVRLLEQALDTPTWPEPHVRGRLLITLALARSEIDGVAAGLTVLDQVSDPNDPSWPHRGLWHGQRGLLLLRAGRLDEADVHLTLALELLDTSEPVEKVRVLLNRGVLALRRGELDRAAADLERCLAEARSAGLTIHAAKAMGNLAYLAHLHGDVPRALALGEVAAAELAQQSATLAAMAAVDRSRSLVAAGLLGEAAATLHAAVPRLGRAGLRQDQAEAELAAAEVARLLGDRAGARQRARRALARFDARGATGWSLLARLELARLDVTAKPSTAAAAAATAGALRPHLTALGLADEARTAGLLQVAGLLAGGDVEGARAVAGRDAWSVTRSPSRARIGTRMLAYETHAALAQRTSEPAAAQRVRQHGLRDLADYQSRFGSLDLLTSATSIGVRLARDGLAEAMRGGRVASVYAWSERVRATSARMVPVRPPVDPYTSALLARLRHLRAGEREQRLAGGAVDPSILREARQLEQEVRERSWQQPGPELVVEPARLDAVRAQLGTDGTLVALMAVGDDVHALTLTASSAEIRAVGSVSALRESIFRVRADLDALAASVLPAALRTTVATSLRSGLAALASLAATTVRGVDLGGPVVVVPAGLSAQVPWTLLPALRGRATCVVPSATWWVTARRGAEAVGAEAVGAEAVGAEAVGAEAVGAEAVGAEAVGAEAVGAEAVGAEAVGAEAVGAEAVGAEAAENGSRGPAGREVFVAGPDVPRAVDEVTTCAAGARDGAVVLLTGADATAEATLTAMDGADVLHVAAHGRHEPENPLFSSLGLADGWLFGHDLDAVGTLPKQVVLSACETGVASMRPGDEALGMTAAFLHGGCRTVVGSVARVGDAAAEQVAVAHHRGVRSGLPPATALADAIASLGDGDSADVAPMVCFGLGW